MPSRETNENLNIASLLALVAALALSVPVVERLIAATWQWYKFANYSDDGHISLSLNTGLLFTCLLAVIFGLAAWFNRIATRRTASRARTSSLMAMWVVAAVAVSYWLLGLSQLNVWRA